MLSKEEVISDLNTICAQTKARWLCYDDIHTVDLQADTARYLKELKRIGYSTIDALAMGHMDLVALRLGRFPLPCTAVRHRRLLSQRAPMVPLWRRGK